MGEQYVLIQVNEDGDVCVEVLDRNTLIKRLNEGYYGEGEHQLILVPKSAVTLGERGSG